MLPNSSQLIPLKNSWATRMADSVLRGYSRNRWKWFYEHGLFIKSLLEAGSAIGNLRYEKFARDWVDHFVAAEGSIRTYRLEEFNLDQINPGKLLFAFHQKDEEDRYAKAIESLANQLRSQPRTGNECFWHKKIYPGQVWLDGSYMYAPFYARYAITFKQPAILEDVTRQLVLIEKLTRDPKTGLLYHAWDETHQQKWANPVTGCSPHFWGRGMGWYAMALVDVLEILPATYPGRQTLIEILRQLSSALLCYQDPASGLWYQVVDLPDRPGNYLESSVSAMLSYVFAKAVRNRILPADYLPAARRAYHGLLKNMIKVDGRGMLALEGTCGVAGLGGHPYRDGTFEYYISEKTISNDFKGVGPFILASLEMEVAGAG